MLQRNQKIPGWTEHGQGRRCIGRKCLGQAVRPNDPQRKSDTDTRVDPKTSPVPRLEGNPPAVRRAFLFYGKKARRASVHSYIHVRQNGPKKQETSNAVNHLDPKQGGPERTSADMSGPGRTPGAFQRTFTALARSPAALPNSGSFLISAFPYRGSDLIIVSWLARPKDLSSATGVSSAPAPAGRFLYRCASISLLLRRLGTSTRDPSPAPSLSRDWRISSTHPSERSSGISRTSKCPP